jgi:hypothetical protein
VTGFATGGPVTRTGLALVHQGEYVVPKGGALATGTGGGMTVNLTVNGWVGNDQEIAERVRRELLRGKGRNGTVGLA